MTPRQLEILQHSLGVDQYGRTPKGFTPYTRNHYCAGGADEETCRELIALGYMQQHPTTEWLPYFNCTVTNAGIKAMHEASPKPPTLSRDKQRYQEFLSASDAFGCTFKEWLQMRKQEWYQRMKAGLPV